MYLGSRRRDIGEGPLLQLQRLRQRVGCLLRQVGVHVLASCLLRRLHGPRRLDSHRASSVKERVRVVVMVAHNPFQRHCGRCVAPATGNTRNFAGNAIHPPCSHSLQRVRRHCGVDWHSCPLLHSVMAQRATANVRTSRPIRPLPAIPDHRPVAFSLAPMHVLSARKYRKVSIKYVFIECRIFLYAQRTFALLR